jgi:hypothetical protein
MNSSAGKCITLVFVAIGIISVAKTHFAVFASQEALVGFPWASGLIAWGRMKTRWN